MDHSSSVKVDHQLWRLSSHPAIVVLAGNNENEAALATDWYNTSATDQEKEFYFGEGFTSNFYDNIHPFGL